MLLEVFWGARTLLKALNLKLEIPQPGVGKDLQIAGQIAEFGV